MVHKFFQEDILLNEHIVDFLQDQVPGP